MPSIIILKPQLIIALFGDRVFKQVIKGHSISVRPLSNRIGALIRGVNIRDGHAQRKEWVRTLTVYREWP